MGNFAFDRVPDASPGAYGRLARRSAFVADWAAASDPGRARAHPEDCWRVAPDPGLLLLADGMGGYNAGEVASAIAVDCVAAYPFEDPAGANAPDPLEQLAQAFGAANAAILAAVARRPECLGMGSTLVAAWITGARLFHAHVGDSRIYLLRDHRLARLTRDHSLGQAMADAGIREGGGGLQSSLRGMLTRALGVEARVDPDFGEVAIEPGDRVLLCSDGVSDLVGDCAMLKLVDRERPAAETVAALIDAALALGGPDNLTAMLAVFDDSSARRG